MTLSLKKRLQSTSKTDSPQALGEALHRSTKKKKSNNHLLPIPHPLPDSDAELTPQPFPTDNVTRYNESCPCGTHYDKQLLAQSYNLIADQLFDLIFGSNEFVQTYRRAQRFYDETTTDWLPNDTNHQRERTLRYKVPFESAFFGKGTILTREKQTLFEEVPGSRYTLEAEVYNEGVKFSDAFSLIMRYCLVQTSSTTTNLRVTAYIIYHRSVLGFIKQLIERNAYSASQEGLKDLNTRLNVLANFQREKRCLSRSDIIVAVPTVETDRQIVEPPLLLLPPSLSEHSRHTQLFESETMMFILILLVLILFCIHIYLSLKLSQMDHLLDKMTQLIKI